MALTRTWRIGDATLSVTARAIRAMKTHLNLVSGDAAVRMTASYHQPLFCPSEVADLANYRKGTLYPCHAVKVIHVLFATRIHPPEPTLLDLSHGSSCCGGSPAWIIHRNVLILHACIVQTESLSQQKETKVTKYPSWLT